MSVETIIQSRRTHKLSTARNQRDAPTSGANVRSGPSRRIAVPHEFGR